MATTATTTARPSNANSSSTATSAGPRPSQASPHPMHNYHSPGGGVGGGGGGGGVGYPVASSGRGFAGRMLGRPDQSGGHQLRGVPALAYRPNLASNMNMMRQHPVAPSGHHHHHLLQHQPYIAPPVRGLSQMKGSPSPGPPVPDSNGFRGLRDRARDDAFVVVRDRKARISDGASLYVLCRSWLRNGLVDENQPHYGDGVRSLPRPLPIPAIDAQSPKKEDEVKIEAEEEQESVDHLSSEDLLKMHIKRAKSVRARLREGRLKRIARYKTRLALLLPPAVEQFRHDPAGGN